MQQALDVRTHQIEKSSLLSHNFVFINLYPNLCLEAYIHVLTPFQSMKISIHDIFVDYALMYVYLSFYVRVWLYCFTFTPF